jgi:2-polyprenyl-3-methyl-5-hydroxy-6-metoxy-1,4-benzoquinol methylase
MSTASVLQRYYDEYWDREQITMLNDPLAAMRLRFLREALAGSGAETALDVGCGTGRVVSALAAEGVHATGMDLSARAVELAEAAHPGCDFVQHGVEALPWPVADGSVDVVVAFEVIEHLLQPERLLQGARDALASNGRLVLTTPYHGRAKNIALALSSFDKHFAVNGDHIRFYTDAALRSSLERAGFVVERVRHFGRVWPLWAGVFVCARKR